MAQAKDGPSVTVYFGDTDSCSKHAMFAIDVAAALRGPDGAKFSATPQSSTIVDFTKPVKWRGK